MPHVAPCMKEIYLRPILGHTLRKLPSRASPRSNLSLHRISSPIIISHHRKKIKSFSEIYMTIFNEFSKCDLYNVHNFGRFSGILPHFRPVGQPAHPPFPSGFSVRHSLFCAHCAKRKIIIQIWRFG